MVSKKEFFWWLFSICCLLAGLVVPCGFQSCIQRGVKSGWPSLGGFDFLVGWFPVVFSSIFCLLAVTPAEWSPKGVFLMTFFQYPVYWQPRLPNGVQKGACWMSVFSLRWSQKVLRNALAYYKLKRLTLWGCGRSFAWETWATWVTSSFWISAFWGINKCLRWSQTVQHIIS